MPEALNYHMTGKLTDVDGEVYSFKCAKIRLDPTGPKAAKVTGFKPCTMQILVSNAAYDQMMHLVEAPAPADAPQDDQEQPVADDSDNPSRGRKRHAAAAG